MGIYKSEAGRKAVQKAYAQFLQNWPVSFSQEYVPTREGDTHVLICGDTSLPPLLLLHGSMGNAAAWALDVTEWSQHYCLYIIDMIGEPGLSAPVRPPLNSDAYALWLDDVLEALKLDHISLVGESLGGWLALDYAIRRSEKIKALALLVPGGVGRQKREFIWKALGLMFLGPWGARKVRKLVFGPPLSSPSPLQQKLSEFLSLIVKNFRPRTEKLPIFDDQALQRIGAPVLAILAGKDVLLDSEGTRRRLEQNLADVEIVYLPDACHLIRDRSSILDFLNRKA